MSWRLTGLSKPHGVSFRCVQSANIPEVQRSDDTKKFYLDTVTDHVFATPEETRARVELGIKRWGEFIKTAKIEPT